MELVSSNGLSPVLPAGMNGSVDVRKNACCWQQMVPGSGPRIEGWPRHPRGHGVSLLISLNPHISQDPTKKDSSVMAFQEEKPLHNAQQLGLGVVKIPQGLEITKGITKKYKHYCRRVQFTLMAHKTATPEWSLLRQQKLGKTTLNPTEGNLPPQQKSEKIPLNPTSAPDFDLSVYTGRDPL